MSDELMGFERITYRIPKGSVVKYSGAAAEQLYLSEGTYTFDTYPGWWIRVEAQA